MRGVRSAFFHSSTIWRITCYGSFVPANGWSCSSCGSNHLRGYTSEPKLRTSPNWWSAPHPPSFQHLVPGRNGVVSKHSPPGLGHWRRGGTQLKARSSPTARGRGHRRLEVNEPFLLLAEQPPLHCLASLARDWYRGPYSAWAGVFIDPTKWVRKPTHSR